VASQVIPISDILARRAGSVRAAVKPPPASDHAQNTETLRNTAPQHQDPRVANHPCYSEEAHHYYARMHIAVAPACNIQCNYCNRKYDCANESRPGVVSEQLTPEQALRKVRAVAADLPQLSVVGIAGPGDALANPGPTFAAFRLIREAFPDLKLCLSTNGLALPDHVEAIKGLGIDHVTITMNALDPEIGAGIYAWVGYKGRRYQGRDGAALLLERQLEGLRLLVEADILVKINSVLIPGHNDGHLADLNRMIKAEGAFLHNIMPLISDPAHGTAFGLTGQREPTAGELRALQESLGQDGRLMRHCRQCRADAVGMLGDDCGSRYALANLPPEAAEPTEPATTPAVATTPRADYQTVVERERADQEAAREAAEAALQRAFGGLGPVPAPLRIAVCTKGGGRLNQHFGHARSFNIYSVGPYGIAYEGIRDVNQYCNRGGSDARMDAILQSLDGVHAILCQRIGTRPAEQLTAAGLTVSTTYAGSYLETALVSFYLAQAVGAGAPAGSPHAISG